MKYAVIKTGGKQYKVTEGQVIEVELLESTDSTFIFEEVLLVVDGDNVQIGTPTVEGMKVYADVIADVKGDKIEVFKYKSKSRYRKHTGHRQKYTQVKINGIGLPAVLPAQLMQAGVKKATEVKKVAPKVKAVETEVVTKVSKVAKVAKPVVVKKVVAKKPAAKKAAK
jgi:large subunit ribosomal protein L21